jgi:hypothetical protein
MTIKVYNHDRMTDRADIQPQQEISVHAVRCTTMIKKKKVSRNQKKNILYPAREERWGKAGMK